MDVQIAVRTAEEGRRAEEKRRLEFRKEHTPRRPLSLVGIEWVDHLMAEAPSSGSRITR